MSSGGLIGIPAQETARFSMFASSLAGTDLPEGWEAKFRFGHDIAQNTNALIEEMLVRDKEWFWYMGDDHAWSPDLLRKLLAHYEPGGLLADDAVTDLAPKCEIIVPLCVMRNPPYRPVIWTEKVAGPRDAACLCEWRGDLRSGTHADCPIHGSAVPLLTLASGSDFDRYDRIELNDYPDGGLIEVAAAGGAGMLIHRSVFDAMPKPWFEAGRGTTARVGEDINFCEKARASGFKIWCDLDSVLGHCCTAVVWPVREPDGWTFGFSTMGGFKVTMPPGFQKLADECA